MGREATKARMRPGAGVVGDQAASGLYSTCETRVKLITEEEEWFAYIVLDENRWGAARGG